MSGEDELVSSGADADTVASLQRQLKAMKITHAADLASASDSYVRSKPAASASTNIGDDYVQGTHYELHSDGISIVPNFKNLESAMSDPVDPFRLLEAVTGRYITTGNMVEVEWPEEVIRGVCLNFKRTKAMFKIREVLRIPYLGDHILVHQGKSNPKSNEFTLKRFSGWLGYVNICHEGYHPEEAPVTAFGSYIEVKGDEAARDTRYMKVGVTTGLPFTMDFIQHIDMTESTTKAGLYGLVRIDEPVAIDRNTKLAGKIRMLVNLFCAAVMIDVNSPLSDYPLMSTLLARNAQDDTAYISFMHPKFMEFVSIQLPLFSLGQKTGDKVVADFKIKFRAICGKELIHQTYKKTATAVATAAPVKKAATAKPF